jgi:hypothetical protein
MPRCAAHLLRLPRDTLQTQRTPIASHNLSVLLLSAVWSKCATTRGDD